MHVIDCAQMRLQCHRPSGSVRPVVVHRCTRPLKFFCVQVEAAGERLQDALSDAWDIVRIPQRPESPKQRASLVHDRINNVSIGNASVNCFDHSSL